MGWDVCCIGRDSLVHTCYRVPEADNKPDPERSLQAMVPHHRILKMMAIHFCS